MKSCAWAVSLVMSCPHKSFTSFYICLCQPATCNNITSFESA